MLFQFLFLNYKFRLQEYDPDLPPELAAATGNHDVPAENTNPGKMDAAQSDLVKEPTFVRPPLVCKTGLCTLFSIKLPHNMDFIFVYFYVLFFVLYLYEVAIFCC